MNPAQSISRAALALTTDCNLRCDYCFLGKMKKAKMSKADAEAALNFLIDSANRKISINFFGGEPVLEDALIGYLINKGRAAAKKKNIDLKFHLTTNGTIYPQHCLESLKSTDLTHVISTDGVQPAHNAHRITANGKGSFTIVEKNINRLLSNNHSIDIRMTLTPYNISFFAESVQYYIEKGVRSVYADIVVEADWNRLLMKRLEQEYRIIASYYINELRNGSNIHIGFIENHIEQKFSRNKTLHCGAGVDNVSIFPDGNIYACYTFAGSWMKSGIGIIGSVKDGIDVNLVKPYLEYKNNWENNESCNECIYSDTCFTSCFGNNLRATGDIKKMPASACMHEKITANIAFEVADILMSEGNEIFCKRISDTYFKPYGYHAVN